MLVGLVASLTPWEETARSTCPRVVQDPGACVVPAMRCSWIAGHSLIRCIRKSLHASGLHCTTGQDQNNRVWNARRAGRHVNTSGNAYSAVRYSRLQQGPQHLPSISQNRILALLQNVTDSEVATD